MNKRFCSKFTKPAMMALIFLLAIGCVTVLTGSGAYGQAQRDDNLRVLVAVGNGEVRARPDLAEVRVGVETEAPNASDARNQNAERARRIISAIRALGIPENQIQTSTFQIFPIRRYDPQPQPVEPPIVGYRVVNVVVVRTENLDLIPRIIDESVRAGANRVEDVSFLLKDERAATQEALRLAVVEARQNAETMARELGVRLVRVQTVQEGGVGVIPPPVFFGRGGAMAAEAAPTPILPGQLTVNASVTLTYVIE